MSSTGRCDDLTPSALMLPIIFFIKAVRGQVKISDNLRIPHLNDFLSFSRNLKLQSSERIVVLCERAEELSQIVAEIEVVNPQLLEKVFFFSGVARNSEHLLLCGVERAQVVAIIHPPRAAEASEEGSETYRTTMVNADSHSIITSLNLHMILQQHKMRQHEDKRWQSRNSLDSLRERETFTGELVRSARRFHRQC